jgi:hypothetical protein
MSLMLNTPDQHSQRVADVVGHSEKWGSEMETPTQVWVVWDMKSQKDYDFPVMLGVFTNQEDADDIYWEDPRARFAQLVAVNPKK